MVGINVIAESFVVTINYNEKSMEKGGALRSWITRTEPELWQGMKAWAHCCSSHVIPRVLMSPKKGSMIKNGMMHI